MTLQSSDVVWYRQPVYQAMMLVSVLFIFHGLVVDLYLGLWARGETTLHILFAEKILMVFGVFTVGLMACTMTRWAAFARNLVQSWHYPEIAFLLFLFMVNGGIFCSLKSVIPHLVPYYLDLLLLKVENFVHLGINPTKVFYDFLMAPWVIGGSFMIYSAWFVIGASFVTLNILWFHSHRGRTRFFLAFSLCWYLNGVVLATLMSSVGPLFLDDFFSGEAASFYRDNVQFAITHSHVLADAKTMMVEWARDKDVVEINGISAMPSMHVSIAALIYFYVRDYFPAFARFFLVFLVLTVLACVVLLTHYAIDGYLAIITTLLIWRWTARYDRPAVLAAPSGV